MSVVLLAKGANRPDGRGGRGQGRDHEDPVLGGALADRGVVVEGLAARAAC